MNTLNQILLAILLICVILGISYSGYVVATNPAIQCQVKGGVYTVIGCITKNDLDQRN